MTLKMFNVSWDVDRSEQMRIKAMNDELKAKGYWIERGKVPITFFHEKYPFIPKEITKEAR